MKISATNAYSVVAVLLAEFMGYKTRCYFTKLEMIVDDSLDSAPRERCLGFNLIISDVRVEIDLSLYSSDVHLSSLHDWTAGTGVVFKAGSPFIKRFAPSFDG